MQGKQQLNMIARADRADYQSRTSEHEGALLRQGETSAPLPD